MPADGHHIELRASELDELDRMRAEADIARTRERVALSVIALRREIARSFDWREWFRRKPVLAIGLAFGVGAFFGWRR